MTEKIPLPSMKTFLGDEVMKPLGVSVEKLASGINVSPQRIENILNNQEKVDADLSIRLGRYFNVDEDLFLNIQNDLDNRQAREENSEQFDAIKPFMTKNKPTWA